ncbi:uncharacterized protein LOC132008352 [Mustela nigripes]|uniref:uncharacterized protein LOC132008352 n=1 Tax=Mustela nigripes TaxID=77151 RepID=UPI0028167907|nr:uncharacterized protein LOC132008352 [Mustela nigripes]
MSLAGVVCVAWGRRCRPGSQGATGDLPEIPVLLSAPGPGSKFSPCSLGARGTAAHSAQVRCSCCPAAISSRSAAQTLWSVPEGPLGLGTRSLGIQVFRVPLVWVHWAPRLGHHLVCQRAWGLSGLAVAWEVSGSPWLHTSPAGWLPRPNQSAPLLKAPPGLWARGGWAWDWAPGTRVCRPLRGGLAATRRSPSWEGLAVLAAFLQPSGSLLGHPQPPRHHPRPGGCWSPASSASGAEGRTGHLEEKEGGWHRQQIVRGHTRPHRGGRDRGVPRELSLGLVPRLRLVNPAGGSGHHGQSTPCFGGDC